MSAPPDHTRQPLPTRVAHWLDQRARVVLIGFVLLTIGFAGANIALDNDDEASQEPAARVFETRDLIDERLPTLLHTQNVVVEAADGGDVLRAEPLAELAANGAALRRADAAGELSPDGVDRQALLADRFDADTNARVVGFVTLAEAVEQAVAGAFGVPLADASDDMVKIAIAGLLADPTTAGLADQISVQATRTERTVLGRSITVVESPAVVFPVQAWNEPLGGGQFLIGPSADPVIHAKEAFNLAVERELRGDETAIRVWGVAAAANETSVQQGRTAAPFIVASVVAAILIVGIALRSYWATALTGAGLAVLMIWLGGISNLVGLKGGLVIDLLVPISMVALGVDFAVHAMSHTRAERHHGARRGFRAGLGGVLGALALAAATDSAAFLSNATSGIESIVHFSLAAGIATVSSFVVLGVIAPLVLSRIEDRLGRGSVAVEDVAIGRFSRSTMIATVRVSVMAGAASIVTLAVSPVLGAALTLGTVMANIVVPFRYARRNLQGQQAPDVGPVVAGPVGSVASSIGDIVATLARQRVAVLAVAGLATAGALTGAVGLQGSFEISDFFSPDTDFVQSVGKIPDHLGSRGGESNTIVVSGDLSQPEAWADVQAFIGDLADNDALAVTEAGAVVLAQPQPVDVLSTLTEVPDQVRATTGVDIIDIDRNGVPDTAEQVRAAWIHALAEGVTDAAGTQRFTADDIATIFDFGAVDDTHAAGDDVMALTVQVPDPSNLAGIERAGDQIAADGSSLTRSPFITAVDATGSGLGRLEVIAASTDALKTSIPVAVVAVLVVLLIGLRSVRYAVISTVPMLLVAAWLYGTMALFGFDLNFVTATIGAISIGVGADYAIHMTQRYRSEFAVTNDHVEAARRAAESTGVALVTSAVSTAVGFGVLAFAPMPLFATFGLLSAAMVLFALTASLIVLPPLLSLVTPVTVHEPVLAPI